MISVFSQVHWACSMGSEDCQEKAKEKFGRWMGMFQPDDELKNPWVDAINKNSTNKTIVSCSRVDVNMKPETYCNAISDGGEEEWDFAWKRSGEISSRNVFFKRCPKRCCLKFWPCTPSWSRYTASTVASEKSTLLSSLGCTKEVWLLNRCFVLLKHYDYHIATYGGVGKVWSKPKLWSFWKCFLSWYLNMSLTAGSGVRKQDGSGVRAYYIHKEFFS